MSMALPEKFCRIISTSLLKLSTRNVHLLNHLLKWNYLCIFFIWLKFSWRGKSEKKNCQLIESFSDKILRAYVPFRRYSHKWLSSYLLIYIVLACILIICSLSVIFYKFTIVLATWRHHLERMILVWQR